ncbi:DNA invertase Pin-like site-specific DNA recombinase [Bradyrhizobium sp. GM5.1]
MAEGKFVSYLRVSRDKQGKSGLGLEAQRAAVESYLNGGKWKVLAEYVEVESGKRNDRPKLTAALAHAKVSGAKVVFAKLDRLTRDVDPSEGARGKQCRPRVLRPSQRTSGSHGAIPSYTDGLGG